MGLAFGEAVRSLRKRLLLAAALLGTVLMVSLAAQAGSLVSVAVRPVLLRLDASEPGQPRPRALALDVDVKLGDLHLHAGWPGFPLPR